MKGVSSIWAISFATTPPPPFLVATRACYKYAYRIPEYDAYYCGRYPHCWTPFFAVPAYFVLAAFTTYFSAHTPYQHFHYYASCLYLILLGSKRSGSRGTSKGTQSRRIAGHISILTLLRAVPLQRVDIIAASKQISKNSRHNLFL